MKLLNWITARTIFYPTLWWNMLLGRWLKVRNWWDLVHPNIIVGAFPFARDVSKMAEQGVGAVVNTCEEYEGPVEQYRQFEIEQFRMPTIDFTHPSYDDVCKAVEFIDTQVAEGKTVYIHCKAGRARSATVAICWLMKTLQITAAEGQKLISEKRPHVNQHLPTRPVVQKFEAEFVKS